MFGALLANTLYHVAIEKWVIYCIEIKCPTVILTLIYASSMLSRLEGTHSLETGRVPQESQGTTNSACIC